jgi:hypothetical protein
MGSHRAASRISHLPALVAAAALAFLATALLMAAPAFAATGTYVRLAQLTPDMAGSDLVLSSVSDPQRSVTIPGVEYGALSDYQLVQPGDYVVGITPEGTTGTPAVSLTLNAMAGASYTLAAVGRAANQNGLSVLTDDLAPPEPGNAKLRVIGAAPNAPVLDVRGPGGDVAVGLPYAGASGYRSLPAGTVSLVVGPPGGSTVDIPVTLAPNQVVSLVLVDRGGAIAADPTVDAEGPSRMPPGPVKAGFGGAAPGQPGEAAGVITFGMLAVAAAALAAGLSRRTGGNRQRS